MKNWKMQKYWYLSVLGLVGFWKFPHVWQVITNQSDNYWDLLNLLWFLWLSYLVPKRRAKSDKK
jgi:hypothetical protein